MQCDVRIKAVTAISMHNANAAVRGMMDKEELQGRKEILAQQRWLDAENGYPEYVPFFRENLSKTGFPAISAKIFLPAWKTFDIFSR